MCAVSAKRQILHSGNESLRVLVCLFLFFNYINNISFYHTTTLLLEQILHMGMK